jgi:hypothetical protein
MKKTLLNKFSLFALLTLLFSTFSYADVPISTSTFGNKAVDGYDVVAYWTQYAAVEGSKKFTYKYKDAKWRFSSAENMELFKADLQNICPNTVVTARGRCLVTNLPVLMVKRGPCTKANFI